MIEEELSVSRANRAVLLLKLRCISDQSDTVKEICYLTKVLFWLREIYRVERDATLRKVMVLLRKSLDEIIAMV